MNWIFRKRFVEKVGDQNATAVFPGTSKFRGKEGDNVLIAEDYENQLRFTYHYEIYSVRLNSEESELVVELSLVEKFEDEKLLTDYMYSLHRISRFDNPKKHFERRYSRLSKSDYSVIVNDEIFYDRTIFGTVINAMPREHQSEFLMYCNKRGISLFGNIKYYVHLLKALIDYVKYSVEKPSRYLQESIGFLKAILGEEQVTSIRFAEFIDNDTETDYQDVVKQLEVINSYLPGFKEILEVAYNSFSVKVITKGEGLRREQFKVSIPIILKEQ